MAASHKRPRCVNLDIRSYPCVSALGDTHIFGQRARIEKKRVRPDSKMLGKKRLVPAWQGISLPCILVAAVPTAVLNGLKSAKVPRGRFCETGCSLGHDIERYNRKIRLIRHTKIRRASQLELA